MADLGLSIPSTGKQSGMKWRLGDAPSYFCFDSQMLCETFFQGIFHSDWWVLLGYMDELDE